MLPIRIENYHFGLLIYIIKIKKKCVIMDGVTD
jgi:hypothetical protein